MNVSKNFITRDLKSLPTDWKWVKLGEVCERITKGGTPTTYGFKFQRSGVRFLKIENVKEGRVILDSITDFISEDAHEYQKKSQLSVGDILFSIAGTIGETCAVREEYLPANTNQAFAIIRGAQEHFNLKFLQFQLESFVAKIKIKARGGAMNNVSLEDLKNFESILPPKDVQHAIVSKIEELLSELDKGKQQLETAQQQLKIYRQAVLKSAFMAIENKSIKTVEECCTHIVDCLHSTAKFSTSGHYCVDTTCIDNGKILFDKIRYVDSNTFAERISRLKPDAGDILFAREGTVGTTVVVPENIELCLGQRMMMFRPKNEIYSKYFMYYFQSSLFKSQYRPLIMGTTAPHLNIRDIRKFEFIVCPLEEQQQLVQEIESRLSVCDKVEETITASLTQAETLRQSILKKAFEGKLL